jgi:hypothetical protein
MDAKELIAIIAEIKKNEIGASPDLVYRFINEVTYKYLNEKYCR